MAGSRDILLRSAAILLAFAVALSCAGEDDENTLLERFDIFDVLVKAAKDRTIAKRDCDINAMDDSCVNGQWVGSGTDGDYFGSDGSPGKRSHIVLPARHHIRLQVRADCSVNAMDDSCVNGQWVGSGTDGDYFGSDGSPGKRSFRRPAKHHSQKQIRADCSVNAMDDSCVNGQWVGSGTDGDYFGSDGSPGKRSAHIPPKYSSIQRQIRADCSVNAMDDSCVNGQWVGSGTDGDYFGSDGSPGKRHSSKPSKHHSQKQIRADCSVNAMDDSCVNGQWVGSGTDGDYFGSDGSPGKRDVE